MDLKKVIDKSLGNLPVKLIIQNIPIIGSSLYTVLSETTNKWREKRFEVFLQKLDEKIRMIEISDQKIVSEMQKKINTEDFYDFFVNAAQKSTMTHKKEKISRFANLLKNYLINDLSSDNYIIEVFFNITDDLSEIEVNKLSELQIKPLEVHYSFDNKPIDIEKMKLDISEKRLSTDFRSIPKEYEYDKFYMYSYNRLEKLDLVQIEIIENAGGYVTVGWSTDNQSTHTQLHYMRKDEITISDFGKNYIDWILN